MIDLNGFKTASIKANDGKKIGYRRIGHGPGIILVHGGLQSSLNFTKLAQALSAEFTVYVPDRRGRGLSAAYAESDDRITEAGDILALAKATGTTNIFGLSSGAIITLQAALLDPGIQKIALYEPPIPLDDRPFKKLAVVYGRAMRAGNLGLAFADILKGTGNTSFFIRLPSFILAPLFNFMIKKQLSGKQENEIALQEIIPTFHHDLIIARGATQLIAEAKNLQTDLLLLQGSKSKAFLKQPLDRLASAIPHTRRLEIANQGHLAADNSGNPQKVAEELGLFFK